MRTKNRNTGAVESHSGRLDFRHFGKIGPGDIVQLEVGIEKKEKETKIEAAAAIKADSAVQNGNADPSEFFGGEWGWCWEG